MAILTEAFAKSVKATSPVVSGRQAADKLFTALIPKKNMDAATLRATIDAVIAQLANNRDLLFQEGDQIGKRPKGVDCPNHDFETIAAAMYTLVHEKRTIVGV